MNQNDLSARVLDLLGEVSGLLEVEEFRDGLLTALGAALPSDYISINQVAADPERNWSVVQPPLPAAHLTTFYRLALQNPLAERFLRTRDGRPLRLSDVCSPAEFHATEIYRDLYAPLHVEHQIAFALPSDREWILAIALSREDPDYTDHERDLLALARPHLIQAYRNALEFTDQVARGRRFETRAPDRRALERLGLTPAQANVLRLVATGRSIDDIAGELDISPRTVQKHLERVYRRLGVSSRSAAARLAWQADRDPS